MTHPSNTPQPRATRRRYAETAKQLANGRRAYRREQQEQAAAELARFVAQHRAQY